ncbi:MAG TPA: DMT family transporter, partial [Vicinamibacterales bacterium]|nr:DMT family transporter [Vicinamibacterales bacterium]
LGGVLLGCSPILVRVSELGPVATAFWRLALALVPLTLLFARQGGGPRPSTTVEHLTAALPGVFLGGDLATWHLSLHMTSVTNSTLLANMAPVVVTLVSWLFLRQRITRTFIAGLALSIAGVVVLNSAALSAGGDSHMRGDAVALGAACFYAGYFIFLARARNVFSTAVVMLWSTIAAAVCVLPIALVFEHEFLPRTIAGWSVLLGLGWLVHAGGQGLIAFSLAWLPATFSSLTLLIQPVVAAVLAWIVLSEPLTASQAIGGAIVIAGILLARRAG